MSGTFSADGTTLTSLFAHRSSVQTGFSGYTQTIVQDISLAAVPLDYAGWPEVDREGAAIGTWVVTASGSETISDGTDTETDSWTQADIIWNDSSYTPTLEIDFSWLD